MTLYDLPESYLTDSGWGRISAIPLTRANGTTGKSVERCFAMDGNVRHTKVLRMGSSRGETGATDYDHWALFQSCRGKIDRVDRHEHSNKISFGITRHPICQDTVLERDILYDGGVPVAAKKSNSCRTTILMSLLWEPAQPAQSFGLDGGSRAS